MLFLGAWVCDRVGKRLGMPDHGALVWDEIVGYAVAVALVPRHWFWMLAAFALFRVLDILKPWPVRTVERSLGGGWGVMMDDIVAGLLTLLALWLAMRWWPL
jgi:phosphatidylglycerophosphatase A